MSPGRPVRLPFSLGSCLWILGWQSGLAYLFWVVMGKVYSPAHQSQIPCPASFLSSGGAVIVVNAGHFDTSADASAAAASTGMGDRADVSASTSMSSLKTKATNFEILSQVTRLSMHLHTFVCFAPGASFFLLCTL